MKKDDIEAARARQQQSVTRNLIFKRQRMRLFREIFQANPGIDYKEAQKLVRAEMIKNKKPIEGKI